MGQTRVRLKILEEKLVRCFDTKWMEDISMILGMQVTRDREYGTLTILQAHCTKRALKVYGMKERKPVHTIGVEPELSTNKGEGSRLIKAGTQRC